MRASAALLALAAVALVGGCRKKLQDVPPPKRHYAVLRTSMGDVKLELLDREAPKTVENFVALSEGTKPWRDPQTGKTRTEPLYRQLPIFRVVADDLIQTGDPAGTGQGNVGFAIPDELGGKFDRPGLVGMANFGPGTAASQFFITLKPMPDLDGRHALFARVVDGLDVVRRISRAPRNETDGSDRPFSPPILRGVSLDGR